MVRFVGCDVHKRTAVFTMLSEGGKVEASHTVAVTRETLASSPLPDSPAQMQPISD